MSSGRATRPLGGRVSVGALASRTGLNATAIWEWGVVERVSTALLCLQVDLQPVGDQMLAVANAIAAS